MNRLIELVAKVSTSRAEDLGFHSHLRQKDFSGSNHTNDLKIGTQVATLSGAWRYSPVTGWPGVRILWLGQVESLICNFYLSVAARKLVWGDALACCWDVKQWTNNHTGMTWPAQSPTQKAGIKPRPAAVKADAIPLGQQDGSTVWPNNR